MVSLLGWLALWLTGHNMHESGHHHIADMAVVPLLAQSAWPWFLMVLAMMSPLHANAVRHLWVRSLSRRRFRAIILFGAVYITVWMLVGVLLLLGAELMKIHAIWGGLAPLLTLLIAFIWQISPWKQTCFNHCHRQPRLSAFGRAADRDCLRFGLTKGFWCVGTCWALMFLPLVFTSTGLSLMLLITLFLFLEQFQPARPPQWGMPLLRNMLNEDNQQPIYRAPKNRTLPS